MKNKLSLVLVLFFLSNITQAQRIIGYFPNYAYTASYNQIQYSKLTHLYYFSLNPDETSSGSTTSNGNLWINDPHSWFNSTNFNNVKTYINTLGTKPKIIIVTGGAPSGDGNLNARFLDIGSNASKLNKFCNALVGFINTNGLDGWDLDWEFPNSSAEKNAHQALVQKMRFKLDSLELVNCKQYEISVAVGGNYTDVPLPAAKNCWNPANTDQMNQATINSVDYFNIMAYDGNTSTAAPCGNTTSHQHYNLLVKAYTEWNAGYTIPASKINLGVGFYNNSGVTFASGGNNSTYYNNATYWSGGGSGCPNMKSKIDYAKANGNSGIFIWHLLQDNLCAGTTPGCYSLLDCIYQYVTSSWGTVPASTNPCSMPVDFLDFKALNNPEGVLLNWTVANEINLAYYSVERSSDAITFQEIKKITGNESSNTTNTYQATDLNSINGKIYYRIAQYDLNGTVHYSNVLSVDNNQNDFGIQLLNNPFSETISIQTYCNFNASKVLLSLLDINGKTLESKEVSLNETIEMGKELPAGFYTILLNLNGDTKRYRAIKQ